jgi:hypothetical protein
VSELSVIIACTATPIEPQQKPAAAASRKPFAEDGSMLNLRAPCALKGTKGKTARILAPALSPPGALRRVKRRHESELSSRSKPRQKKIPCFSAMRVSDVDQCMIGNYKQRC